MGLGQKREKEKWDKQARKRGNGIGAAAVHGYQKQRKIKKKNDFMLW